MKEIDKRPEENGGSASDKPFIQEAGDIRVIWATQLEAQNLIVNGIDGYKIKNSQQILSWVRLIAVKADD